MKYIIALSILMYASTAFAHEYSEDLSISGETLSHVYTFTRSEIVDILKNYINPKWDGEMRIRLTGQCDQDYSSYDSNECIEFVIEEPIEIKIIRKGEPKCKDER